MKIALCQINPTIGAISENLSHMLAMIDQAEAQGAQIVIFSELCVSGYPPKDLLLQADFIKACLSVQETLISRSNDSLAIIWGNIDRNTTGTGKPLYNSAYVAWQGKLETIYHKRLLPNYDVFDEARYFEPGHEPGLTQLFGQTLGLSVCEDIWNAHVTKPLQDSQLLINPIHYLDEPISELTSFNISLLLNLSASPFSEHKPVSRQHILHGLAQTLNIPIAYCNQVGGNDDLLFDGGSLFLHPQGITCAQAFQEDLLLIDTEQPYLQQTQAPILTNNPDNEALFDALVLGIKDYTRKCGFKNVLIGLSGGIDSALTATLATFALGAEHVMGITMPSQYSSQGSIDDSQVLAKNLGIAFQEIPIEPVFNSYLQTITGTETPVMDLAEQNLQARIRGSILMTLSNRYNRMVLTTGNKSEISMGYCTLYGDTCGGLAVLADLWKTQVFELSAWINQHKGAFIPVNTLEKPPSAELAPNQLDTDSLPPYHILDPILKGFLVDNLDIGELLDLGYDEAQVTRVLASVSKNEYKRQQLPTGLRVSSKAFGTGRHFPIAQRFSPNLFK